MHKVFKNKQILRHIIASSVTLLFVLTANANPVVGNISAGKISIKNSPNTTTIYQSSQRGIINWNSFNIGKQEATRFIQPNGGVTLNRISPLQGASQIYGVLTATGRIILVNPGGIYFGPSAYVNVGGLIATTNNITDKDFLSGNYQFSKVPSYSGSVVNDGKIVADNGLVALVGAGVENNGLIRANLGHIVLASGDAFTMSFAGNDLIHFAITAPTSSAGTRNGKKLSSGVKNTGQLIANGGQILVTAQAAKNVLDNVINMEGIAQAKSVYKQNGEIIISGDPNGGTVRVAAKIAATGKNKNQKGGNVKITGHDIELLSPTVIDVSGDAGGGNINIGGNKHGAGPLPNANSTVMEPGVILLADALTSGDGGNIVLWSDDLTKVYGSLSAKGGAISGNGGFIETSGKTLDVSGISINTSAPHGKTGTWLLDPTNLTIANNGGVNSNLLNPSTGVFEGDPDQNTSIFDVGNLITALGSSNVIVETTSGGAGAGTGNITVSAPITWTNTNSLSLNAFGNIGINSAITNNFGGNLTLEAPNGTINITAPIQLTGGSTVGNIGSSTLTLTALQGDGLVGTITDTSSINVNNFQLLQGNWVQQFANQAAYNAAPFTAYNFTINKATYLGNNSLSTAQFIRVIGPNLEIQDVYGLQGMGGSTVNQFVSNQLWTLPTGGYTLDASATQHWNWNSGLGAYNGFSPSVLGQASNRGINGNNATITGLYINRPTQDNIGLIGSTDFASGFVQNLNLVGANITGRNAVGGVVGRGPGGGGLQNVTIDSTSTITGQSFVGGIVGNAAGDGFTNVTSSATVNGDTIVGGIAGYINISSLVSQLTNNGQVSGNSLVGGLVGFNDFGGIIQNSINNGNVIGNNASSFSIGGIVGENAGTLSNVSTTGSVSGGSYVGGLAGYNYSSGNLAGNISVGGAGTTVTADSLVGGLMGGNEASIDNSLVNISFNTSVLLNSGGSWAGGLVGWETTGSSLSNFNIALPNVSGPTNTFYLGGLVGLNEGTISNSSATNSITGGTIVGGLVGDNTGVITTANTSSSVTGSNNVGGLVGSNSGTISNSSSTSGVSGNNAGGLIGLNTSSGLFTNLTRSGGTAPNKFIGNLVSGNGNTITINGNSISKTTGASSSTLSADNTSNTWRITGSDSGSLVGKIGTFSNIQNLLGGSGGDNNFIFSNNSSLSGSLNGGSLSNTNTLNYLAYDSPVNVVLASGIYQGNTINNNSNITSFLNINNLIGNSSYNNIITLPNKKNTVVITGPLKGFINDPLYFNGFSIFKSVSGIDTVTFNTSSLVFINPTTGIVTVDGFDMTFDNFSFSPTPTSTPNSSFVAGVLLEGNGTSFETSPTSFINTSVEQNISDILKETQTFDDFSTIQINPYCSG